MILSPYGSALYPNVSDYFQDDYVPIHMAHIGAKWSDKHEDDRDIMLLYGRLSHHILTHLNTSKCWDSIFHQHWQNTTLWDFSLKNGVTSAQ